MSKAVASYALDTDTIREEFNRMRGRICGLIEAVGMPDKQERGAISTFKTLSYDSENLVVEMVEAILDQSDED